MKLNDLDDYGNVETATIARACSEMEAAQLLDILRKYTSTDDMFTEQYLHGRNENIKLLVEIGKAVETPDAAVDMYKKLMNRDTLYVRCLVEAFTAWHNKTREPPIEVKVEAIL